MVYYPNKRCHNAALAVDAAGCDEIGDRRRTKTDFDSTEWQRPMSRYEGEMMAR